MEAILKYDLNSEEDRDNFDNILRANKMQAALFELAYNLRSKVMGQISDNMNIEEVVDLFIDSIINEIENNGINIDEL